MRRRWWTIAAAALAACTGAVEPAEVGGSWGGEHIRMEVGAGGATLEYDCAHGSIDEPILPGAGGGFTALGTHVREHGGPVRQDEVPDRHPARYEGRVRGEAMTLSVTLTDSGERVGSFTLRRGDPGRVLKCL